MEKYKSKKSTKKVALKKAPKKNALKSVKSSDFNYISISIQNKTDIKKKVNLFSLDIPVPEGVEVKSQPTSYDFVMKTLHEKMLVHGARLAVQNTWDFTEPIYIINRDKFGRSISYPILPFLYQSIFQFNSNLVDMTPNQFIIQNGLEVETEVAPNSFRNFTFLISKKSINASLLKNNEERKMYGSFTPILLENDTDQIQETSLFNLAIVKGEPDDEAKQKQLDLLPVKITSPFSGGYLRLLNQMLADEERMASYFARLNNIKILTDNNKNLGQVLVEEIRGTDKTDASEKLICLSDYISPFQFLENILDIRNFKYKWTTANTLNFKLQPKSKMFVVFYEIDKDFLQTEVEKFISEHKTKLNDLGLMLVPSDGGNKLSVI